jgi:hypothetical protein
MIREKSAVSSLRLENLVPQVRRIFGGTVLVRLAVVTGLLTLLAIAVLVAWKTPVIASKAPTAQHLGLQVKKDGTEFLVSWDPTATEIVSANDAELVISDDSRTASNGKSEPLLVPLGSSQLKQGSLIYRSPSVANKVAFQLKVKNSAGNSFDEAVSSAGDSSALRLQAASRNSLRPYRPPSAPGASGTKNAASAMRARIFVAPKREIAANAAAERVFDLPQVAMLSEQAADVNQVLLPPSDSMPPKAPFQSGAGLITITSEPSGANVTINSTPAGITPLTLQVKPVGLGFTVEVTKDGFTKWMVQTSSTERPYALHAQLSLILR